MAERGNDPGLERFISIQNVLRTVGALTIAGTVYGVMKVVQHFRHLPEEGQPTHDGYSALRETEEGYQAAVDIDKS